MGPLAVSTRGPARPLALDAPPAGRRHVAGVAALTTAAAALYTTFALLQHWTLHTSSFDSVIFDQEVRAFAHLRAPIVPVKGVHAGFGPHFNVLGDHFTPMFAVLAPFYRLWPNVAMLLVAQALLLALSVVPVWVFTRRALGARAAYLVGGAYVLAWGLQSALEYDVHEVMFAVPLIAWALERAQARRPVQATVLAALTLFVKEDYGLFVAGFGIYLALVGWRRLGLGVLLLGLAAFETTTQVVIPALAGGHAFAYFAQSPLGDSLPSVLWTMVRHPLRALDVIVSPATKWQTLLWTFAPWGFLSLASPIVVLAVPLLAVRLLGSNPHWWGTAHQYSAALMPIVVLAAVDGLARLLPWVRARRHDRVVLGWSAAVLVGALALCAVFPFHRLALAREWRLDAWQKEAYAVMAVVPDGVTVEADSKIGPHIAHRTTVWLLDKTPRGAPWVVAMTDRREWPFDTVEQARDRVALLERSGYQRVYDRAGWVVLHRP